MGVPRRKEATALSWADMGWVLLEAACNNRGDITELGYLGGVWGYVASQRGWRAQGDGFVLLTVEVSQMGNETDPRQRTGELVSSTLLQPERKKAASSSLPVLPSSQPRARPQALAG